MIMAKEKVNYQEVYDLYQLCSDTDCDKKALLPCFYKSEC